MHKIFTLLFLLATHFAIAQSEKKDNNAKKDTIVKNGSLTVIGQIVHGSTQKEQTEITESTPDEEKIDEINEELAEEEVVEVSESEQEKTDEELDVDLNIKDNTTLFYKVGNTMYNRNDYVILRWAQSVKQNEQLSQKKASKLWQKLHLRKMTRSERKAFTTGYNSAPDLSVENSEITATGK